MDVIIAVIIFISAFSAFIMILSTDFDSDSAEDLKGDAEMISRKLFSEGDNSFVQGDQIDIDKLKEIQNSEYSDLKTYLGIKEDFCIYFEDKEGNLIKISDFTGEGDKDYGLGDSELILSKSSNIYC